MLVVYAQNGQQASLEYVVVDDIPSEARMSRSLAVWGSITALWRLAAHCVGGEGRGYLLVYGGHGLCYSLLYWRMQRVL